MCVLTASTAKNTVHCSTVYYDDSCTPAILSEILNDPGTSILLNCYLFVPFSQDHGHRTTASREP